MRLFAIEKVRTDRLHGIRVLALTMKKNETFDNKRRADVCGKKRKISGKIGGLCKSKLVITDAHLP